jgi:hypothetical protein
MSETARIDRVPRTPAERDALLRERPDGWEFLLFGACLYEKERELEPRWEALTNRKVPEASLPGPPSALVDPGDPMERMGAMKEATDRLTAAFQQSSEIASQAAQTMTAERSEQAFGKLGESGDPEEIERFADDVMKPYREFFDWMDRLDAEQFPPSLQGLYVAAREGGLQPLAQFRAYIADVLRHLDDLPAAIRESRAVDLTFKLTLAIDDEAVERYTREAERLVAENEREGEEWRKLGEEWTKWADRVESGDYAAAAEPPPTHIALPSAEPSGGETGIPSPEIGLPSAETGLRAKWRARHSKRDADKSQRRFDAELAGWQSQRDAIAEELDLAEHFTGDSNSNQLILQRGEALFGFVTGASLVEDRSTGGRWEGRSGGFSFPIGSIGGRSIRYRTGRTRGHYVQGTPVPTAIDVGTLFITNKRTIFQGQKQTRECRFDKLVGVQHSPDGSTVFNVSNRQKATVISYGPELTGWVAFRLGLALAHYQGTVPAIVEQLRGELAELDRGRPAP